MTSSEGGQTLKATIRRNSGSGFTATPQQEIPSASSTQVAAEVEATHYCSKSQRKRILRWLGGIQQEAVYCTCSTPQQIVSRDTQNQREVLCGFCGGQTDTSISLSGLLRRRRSSSSGSLFSTAGMLGRVGKVFGRKGEGREEKQKQKSILENPSTINEDEMEFDGKSKSSDSTETQQSENTLAWLSGDGSSGADGGGGGGGGNKKPDLGLDEKAARLRRAQKLLNKSGNG